VNKTSSDSGDEESIVNLELNSMLKLLLACGKHVVQALGLSDSTRESIKDETIKFLLSVILLSVKMLGRKEKKPTRFGTQSWSPARS